ncbi:MAG: WD40 repeat domain-containing protein [Pyrinomonadaceae bacterium]
MANMNSVRMWDVVLGTEVFRQEPGNKFNPKHSRLTPNGKWIISYSSKFVAPNTFHLFTATDVETKKIVEISEEKNIGFTFSDDSNLLFVNSTYHFGEGEARTTKTKIKVYKVGTWELVRTYDDTYSTVHFDVSTKRQLMVSGAMDGKFRVFSLESGKLIGEEYYYKRIPLDDFLRTPHITSFVGPVEFSPDGTMLMTAGARGNVILWKLEFDVNPK